MAAIMIADDDDTCRDSIRRVFERAGYCVETASDVDSAMDAIRARHFDLVVCDYRMPGKTGMDLLRGVKCEQPKLPVLMISACADAATEERAMELGAVEFMRKPIRRQDLIARTARVMGG